ncbi:MAG: N-acetyltransferase family protein [Acetobacteraceae bacterium]|nr:N-acetyltransferase family protein [Acetobacteraceae bacterium]
MPRIIRDSTDSDPPAITAIYAHAVRQGLASFESEPPDLADMTRRRAAILSRGFPHIVAEMDGCVIGYAYAGAYRTLPPHHFTLENSIYVAPDQQGAGIGRALLSALIARCTQAEFHIMVAVIGDSLPTPLRPPTGH